MEVILRHIVRDHTNRTEGCVCVCVLALRVLHFHGKHVNVNKSTNTNAEQISQLGYTFALTHLLLHFLATH